MEKVTLLHVWSCICIYRGRRLYFAWRSQHHTMNTELTIWFSGNVACVTSVQFWKSAWASFRASVLLLNSLIIDLKSWNWLSENGFSCTVITDKNNNSSSCTWTKKNIYLCPGQNNTGTQTPDSNLAHFIPFIMFRLYVNIRHWQYQFILWILLYVLQL